MDCSPPAGAEVLPAASGVAMEVDAAPASSRAPAATPMEGETPACASPQQTPRRRITPARDTAAANSMDCDFLLPAKPAPTQEHPVQPSPAASPLDPSGIPSARVEDCLEWLAGHTHFSVADSAAALRQLSSDTPLALLSGDSSTDRDLRYSLLCDTLRRENGDDSLPEDAYGLACPDTSRARPTIGGSSSSPLATAVPARDPTGFRVSRCRCPRRTGCSTDCARWPRSAPPLRPRPRRGG